MASAFMQKVVPALDTTFSSNITLPKSSAPNRSATWPTSGPCVTQEAPTWSTLSSRMRATAC